jgi:hypothetical protein
VTDGYIGTTRLDKRSPLPILLPIAKAAERLQITGNQGLADKAPGHKSGQLILDPLEAGYLTMQPRRYFSQTG